MNNHPYESPKKTLESQPLSLYWGKKYSIEAKTEDEQKQKGDLASSFSFLQSRMSCYEIGYRQLHGGYLEVKSPLGLGCQVT